MTLLRIYCSLLEAPVRCQWALIDGAREPVRGEGALAQLPRRAARVELVIPAAQVLITRAQLPPAARRRAGSVLAFAVEAETLGDPEANEVSWLGASGSADVLAVVNKPGLKRWLDALDIIGVAPDAVHCEILLLPWTAGQWSLAWDGREGFVRSGKIEGAATDCGDRQSPPLSLRLMLEATAASGAQPAAIAVYVTAPNAAPNIEAWQRELGIALRLAGSWDWRTASPQASVSLMQARRRWHLSPLVAGRLRPVAWIAGAALALHALALVADWTLLADEQRALRRQMEQQFRAAFPEAVAVSDPALQMRRKLAEARHATGQTDSGDFLPMIEKVAVALNDLPGKNLRIGSYESGRLTLELAATDEAGARRIVERLLQAGLTVDASPAAPRAAGAPWVITVRAS